ncbi:MAG TPA: hypothetical protein VFG11_01730 [Acidobacteriota bacterium]|nr:hypothetical protein [Acidobacteriota bacterium]
MLTLLLKVIAFPLLFFVPGLCLLRRMTPSRSLSFFVLSFCFSLPLTSIAGFALAETNLFSLIGLIAADAAISIVVSVLPIRGNVSLAGLDNRFCAVLIVLASVFFLYYRPPFEYYLGGRDPGIYVINGIRIARTGSFLAKDPLVTQIPEEYRPLFFAKNYPIRYMGFQINDRHTGVIAANFFYLYPVWIAIFYLLFGVHGCLFATTFFAACLLLMIGLFAATMLNTTNRFVPVILLGASAPFLWFSRFPNSELTAGFLIFCGLFCLAFYRLTGKEPVERNLSIELMGAVCLALSFWARIDAALMGIPLAVLIVYRYADRTLTRNDLWIALIYGLFVLIGLAHVKHSDPLYLQAAFFNLKFKPSHVIGAGLVAGLAGLATAWLARRVQLTRRPALGYALAAVLSALLLYGYAIRPFYPVTNIGSPNAEAFFAIGWYLTHPVVFLALVGIVLYVLKVETVDWVFLVGALIYAFLYFYRIRGHAEHFWMLRRYLMVIFPAIALMAAYAAQRIVDRFKLRFPIPLVAAVLLAVLFYYQDLSLHHHHEYAGSFRFIEKLASRIGPQDLLIVGAKEANDLHIVGPMLSYYFDSNVVPLISPKPDLALLNGMIRSWKGKVWFAGAGNTNLASADFSLHPVDEIHFETPEFDEIYHKRPTQAFSKIFLIGWYQMESVPPRDPLFVDIGHFDDGRITNFYLTENYGEGSYRWTNGHGHVYFPPIQSRIKSVVLRMNPGAWVPGMERVKVQLLINGSPLVDLQLRNGYNSYEVEVPATLRQALTGVPVDLQVESRTWVPRRVLDLPDKRRLGVIVDWVRLTTE